MLQFICFDHFFASILSKTRMRRKKKMCDERLKIIKKLDEDASF